MPRVSTPPSLSLPVARLAMHQNPMSIPVDSGPQGGAVLSDRARSSQMGQDLVQMLTSQVWLQGGAQFPWSRRGAAGPSWPQYVGSVNRS